MPEKTRIPPLLAGLPRHRFVEVVADVPWAYAVRSGKGLGRSAEKHYGTMSLEAISAIPVGLAAAPNARLWFWVTGPFLAIGAHVPIMRAWGFEPCAIAFVWIKPNRQDYEDGHLWSGDNFKVGMGHTTRQNAEYVVLGNRGKPPKRRDAGVRQVIVEPAREHSRKPDKFYTSVERYARGPFLELFGRSQRPGWTVRGNEAEKFK